jgi:hypothetical protein
MDRRASRATVLLGYQVPHLGRSLPAVADHVLAVCSHFAPPGIRVHRTAVRQLALFVLEGAAAERGELLVRHAVPYAYLGSLTEEERRRYTDWVDPLVHGHTLEDWLGGQLDAGFVLMGFCEDRDPGHPLARLLTAFAATRAVKPRAGP